MRSHLIPLLVLCVLCSTLVAQAPSAPKVRDGETFFVATSSALNVSRLKVGEEFTLHPNDGPRGPQRIGDEKIASSAVFHARVLKAVAVPKKQKGDSELAFVVYRVDLKSGPVELNAYPVGLFGYEYASNAPTRAVPAFAEEDQSVPGGGQERPPAFSVPNQGPNTTSTGERRLPLDTSPKVYLPFRAKIIRSDLPGNGTMLHQDGNIDLPSGVCFQIEQRAK